MPRLMRFVMCGCIVLAAVLVTGCQTTASLSGARRQAIATSIDSATRAFEAAERARDPERVLAHLAPEFYMYVDGVRTDYDAVVAGIRSTIGTFAHFEPGFADLEVLVLGRSAGVASFTFRDSIVTETGDLLLATGPTTLVWERRGVDWLITYADADHYPVVPVPAGENDVSRK